MHVLVLAAVFGLALTCECLAQANSAVQTRRFCQFAAEHTRSGRSPENVNNREEQRSLATLISLAAPSVRIESRTPDWKDDAEALARVTEVLASKPGFLMPHPGWAEFVLPTTRDVIASLDRGGTARMEIAGHHVCVRDGRGQMWFFRTLPVDGWIR